MLFLADLQEGGDLSGRDNNSIPNPGLRSQARFDLGWELSRTFGAKEALIV